MQLLFPDIILLSILLINIIILISTLIYLFITKVPYVPSSTKIINELINHIHLPKNSKVLDLGCGDGKILFKLEKKFNCNYSGIEISPLPFIIAKIKQKLTGSKVNFHFKNFFKFPINNHNYIFCYLTPNMLKKLTNKFLTECKKGTKIITHTFKIPDLTPTEIIRKNQKLPPIYIYEI